MAFGDTLLRDKEFEIAHNLKSDGYQRGLASITFNFLNNK